MATKEPWNNEIYQAMREDREPDDRKRTGRPDPEKKPLTTRFLTFLVVLLFIMVGLALVFVLWNNRGSGSIAQNFSSSSASSSSSLQQSSTSETTSETQSSQSSTSSSSSSSATGSTYTIVAGDDPNTIASKTGVAWATIASLNNISDTGYNADGSAIYAGQVLKLK